MDKLFKTMPAVLRAAGASEEVSEAACIAAWRHAVGEGLSAHTVPVQLRNKTLIVAVADNIWQRQLEQMRGQLLFRLNSLLGEPLVKSIEWRVDPTTLARRAAVTATGPQGHDSSDYRVPAELLQAAAGIADVELRRAFLGAATSCVRRLEKPQT
jgi:predicted nucleic acid-binding Zn ribbon protein